MKSSLTDSLSFIQLMEQLKNELRHSWTSTGRQESVAEHSWRLCLMVMTFAPELEHPIDVNRAIKMALIHDCVEAIVGDTPVFELMAPTDKARKAQQEQHAIEAIAQRLNSPLGDDIKVLWEEFEAGATREAKVVNALDKLECKIQHNEADISTWNEAERNFSLDWDDSLYDFDSTILALKNKLQKDSQQKVGQACSSD